MKDFLKILISIIVIFCIVGVSYYLLNMNKNYNSIEIKISGDKKQDIKDEKVDNIPEIKDDKKDEILNLTSGEVELKNEEKILEEISLIEKKNKSSNKVKDIEDTVGIEIMGKRNEQYLKDFEVEKFNIQIQVAGSMIYIISPEFVDNMQYHFDSKGNLVLYISESTTIGGESRYYFNQGKLIKKDQTIDAEGIKIDFEDEKEILERSKTVYEKYFK